MNKRIDIIRNITIDALFLALILLFTYVPQIGYIQVMPTMAITTIHLVVLIGASLFVVFILLTGNLLLMIKKLFD